MAKNSPTSEQVEALLDVGVRNRWYALAPSSMIGDKPIGLSRLGERVAAWRDNAGVARVIADRCPHRGAPLSLGANLGNRVACAYHGVEVDGEGVVVAVPAIADCPLVGEKAVKSYPTCEIRGAVFAYFGDVIHPEPVELTLPAELTSPAFDGFLCSAHWDCNYRYAVDNVMDPMHGAFLHAVSHSMSEGAKRAQMAVRKTEHGLIFEKKDQRDVNFDWVEFGDTGAHWMRLEIPYPATGGPGSNFTIIGFVTPIDARSCRVFFWRIRKVEGWQRDMWRFLYKNRLEGRHWDVLEQDRRVLEVMPHDARDHEFLYQHDVGLARVRGLLRDEASAQLEALAEAGRPASQAAE